MTRSATAPRRRLRAAAAAALVALAAPVAAPGPAVTAVAQGGGNPSIACRCRANGHDYELGERACLRTPAGLRLAECRMVQNVTSWSVLAGAAGEGCGVVSGLAAPPAAPRPSVGGG